MRHFLFEMGNALSVYLLPTTLLGMTWYTSTFILPYKNSYRSFFVALKKYYRDSTKLSPYACPIFFIHCKKLPSNLSYQPYPIKCNCQYSSTKLASKYIMHGIWDRTSFYITFKIHPLSELHLVNNVCCDSQSDNKYCKKTLYTA